ncbi:MAG: hypothetical protein F9K42_04625, partial [Ignavibacterium sp.]
MRRSNFIYCYSYSITNKINIAEKYSITADAKVRRNSTDPEDLFIAHIAGMDVFARSLIIAEKILTQSDY